MNERELTEMQQAFVVAFVSGPGVAGNATKAAQEAGYSTKSARVQAQQLLAKPHVQAAIVHEQRRCLSGLASIGLVEAEKMLTSPETPAGVKADLIKAAWDRGGLAVPKREAPEKQEKELHEMTTKELQDFIREGMSRLKEQTGAVKH